MPLPTRYPPATWRPVDYIGEAGRLVDPRGWVLHVVEGNGSPLGTFQRAVSPDRRFSHLWVSKAGAVEQYQWLDRASWAQGTGGNPWGWSVETEGFPGERLTAQQLDALAAWHVWCGAADRAVVNPGESGIGTHSMGGASWGNHPGCPGPIRAGQRTEILRRAAALREVVPVAAPKFTAVDLAPVWASKWGSESAGDRLAAAAAGTALLPVLAHLVDQVTALSMQVGQLQQQVAALTPKS